MPRLDTQNPPRISNLDYNAIRTIVDSVLGAGTAQKGYGQTLKSSAVFAGNQITKLQWDQLRYDLVNIRVHQTGTAPSIVEIASGAVIRYGAGHPNNNYEEIANRAVLDKFLLGAGQFITTNPNVGTGTPGTQSRTGAWSNKSECILTVTFADANRARYFFNSGGKLQLNSSRTGGSSVAQNTAWTNLLNGVGTVEFSATKSETVNFYSLTTSYVPLFQRSASSPYSDNLYKIEVNCNCTGANNSTATANIVRFKFTWIDDYVDPGNPPLPGDEVDGTLSAKVTEIKAYGTLVPSGEFIITSPTYSFSSITAS